MHLDEPLIIGLFRNYIQTAGMHDQWNYLANRLQTAAHSRERRRK